MPKTNHRLWWLFYLFRKSQFSGIFLSPFLLNAHAVVKCVNLSPSATTCSGNIMSSSGADWVATCTTNGSSISIRGVSACECSATASVGGATAPSIGTAKSSLKTCNSAGSLMLLQNGQPSRVTMDFCR